MTPDTLHSLTLARTLSKIKSDFLTDGDGTPRHEYGIDNKDRLYWQLGMMIANCHRASKGFEELSIVGLPAYRAIENMQVLMGAGIPSPIKSYVGLEIAGYKGKFVDEVYDPNVFYGKIEKVKDFYKEINAALPKSKQLPITVELGDIFDYLRKTNNRFNVFDFDLMVTPVGWCKSLRNVPTTNYIKREDSFIFLKPGQIKSMIESIQHARTFGPIAIYCNWAAGRHMTDKNWLELRKDILRQFQDAFGIVEAAWTEYHGNSRMKGLQLILEPQASLRAEEGSAYIKFLRLLVLKMSITEVANERGITRRYASKLENKTNLDLKHVVAMEELARKHNVSEELLAMIKKELME